MVIYLFSYLIFIVMFNHYYIISPVTAARLNINRCFNVFQETINDYDYYNNEEISVDKDNYIEFTVGYFEDIFPLLQQFYGEYEYKNGELPKECIQDFIIQCVINYCSKEVEESNNDGSRIMKFNDISSFILFKLRNQEILGLNKYRCLYLFKETINDTDYIYNEQIMLTDKNSYIEFTVGYFDDIFPLLQDSYGHLKTDNGGLLKNYIQYYFKESVINYSNKQIEKFITKDSGIIEHKKILLNIIKDTFDVHYQDVELIYGVNKNLYKTFVFGMFNRIFFLQFKYYIILEHENIHKNFRKIVRILYMEYINSNMAGFKCMENYILYNIVKIKDRYLNIFKDTFNEYYYDINLIDGAIKDNYKAYVEMYYEDLFSRQYEFGIILEEDNIHSQIREIVNKIYEEYKRIKKSNINMNDYILNGFHYLP